MGYEVIQDPERYEATRNDSATITKKIDVDEYEAIRNVRIYTKTTGAVDDRSRCYAVDDYDNEKTTIEKV